ncbi:MAG: hypothetical protein LBG60_15710 [Bifidobacteriaceae bacterium]|jgi:hypothetical protein|nr:hypothetical protein [Bifidobacteriaceae bacterium]
MDGIFERAWALRRRIEASDLPVTWRTPSDLARRSAEAAAAGSAPEPGLDADQAGQGG